MCFQHAEEKGRRKNTFIKIARDHRNALVYGRVQNGKSRRGRGVFNQMAGDELSFSFFFLTIKWSVLHEIDCLSMRYEILT